jgi:hypothetical protein
MIFPASAAGRGQPQTTSVRPARGREDHQPWSRTGWMVRGQARRRRRRVPIVVDRISVGSVLPRAGGSGVAGVGWVFCRGVEGGGAISCGCIWGEPFSRCVDHLRGNDGELLAVTQTRFVKRPPIVEVVAAVDSQDYQGPSVQGVELG